jgi:hypothetical protein
MILEEGHDMKDLEDSIPSDFFNASDLNENNWSLIPGCGKIHITGKESIQGILTQARALKMQKHKVLFDIDSMAYGGGEGYVPLYVKSADEGKVEV